MFRVGGGARSWADDVPPGAYTLVVWHDGQNRETREVRVPDQGSVEADFVVR